RTGEVRVIRWSTLRLIGAWSHTASIAAVAFSADGRSVASADEAGALRVVPLAPDGTGPQRDWVPLTVDRRLDQGTVQFDPTGRFVLLRAGSTGALLDARTGEPGVEGGGPGPGAGGPG